MAQSKGRLPTELPFLPLYNQVLLPGAFARVHFKRSGPVRWAAIYGHCLRGWWKDQGRSFLGLLIHPSAAMQRTLARIPLGAAG